MSTSTSSVYDTFWNTFMIEAMDLFARNMIFKERRTSSLTILDLEPESIVRGLI